MKTKIGLLFVFILLLAGFVHAGTPIPPYAISGKVSLQDGTCVSGFDIKVKAFSPESGTIVEQKISISPECEYAVVLGNEPFSIWYKGFSTDITFCDVSKNAACLKIVKVGFNGCEEGGGCRLDFIYNNNDLTPAGESITNYITKFVCPDGSKVDDASQCPAVIIPPAKIICKDGTEVTNANDCLETPGQVKDYGLTYGVVIGAAAAGLIAYWIRRKRARGKKMVDTYIRKRKK